MCDKANAPDFDSSDILQEKSLFAIWQKCRRLPRNWFNVVTTLLVVVLLTGHVVLTRNTTSELAQSVRDICDTGLNFSASILGFLLAGFTIFATMTRPDLMIRMAKKRHEGSNLSYLKYNYFALMEVFILYAVFVALCFLVKLFLGKGSGICHLINEHTVDSVQVRYWLVRIAYVFIGTSFIYLILALKSFIFNVYHIVMTGLKWEMWQQEQKEKDQMATSAQDAGDE